MGNNALGILMWQIGAFMVLPILLYVALVLTAAKVIKQKLLGYEETYLFKRDCEDETFIPIALFGMGLLCVVVILPVTLILLPFAFYWLVFKIQQTIYMKFIKYNIC